MAAKQQKAPSIDQRPNPYRLWQDDAVIRALEDEITECIEADTDIPASLGEKLAVMIADKQDVIDRVVTWLFYQDGRIESAKQMESFWRSVRKRLETAKKTICTNLQRYIDDPANAEHVTDGNKLTGSVLKLWTQQSPAHLEIHDETAIPDGYKYWEFTVRARVEDGTAGQVHEALGAFVNAFQPEADETTVRPRVALHRVLRPHNAENGNPVRPLWEHIDERMVRDDLAAGREVPGAAMIAGRHVRHTKASREHLAAVGALDIPVIAAAEEAEAAEEEDNG